MGFGWPFLQNGKGNGEFQSHLLDHSWLAHFPAQSWAGSPDQLPAMWSAGGSEGALSTKVLVEPSQLRIDGVDPALRIYVNVCGVVSRLAPSVLPTLGITLALAALAPGMLWPTLFHIIYVLYRRVHGRLL